jgi:hypothetical protein
MTDTKLSNAPGHHIHQDLLIRNNFRRSLDKMWFHNLGSARITLTGLNSEPEWKLTAFQETSAGKLAGSIVHNLQNTTGYSRCVAARKL